MPSESGEKYLFFKFLNDRFNSKGVKYGIPEFFAVSIEWLSLATNSPRSSSLINLG
jgi:hypothetical protein